MQEYERNLTTRCIKQEWVKKQRLDLLTPIPWKQPQSDIVCILGVNEVSNIICEYANISGFYCQIFISFYLRSCKIVSLFRWICRHIHSNHKKRNIIDLLRIVILEKTNICFQKWPNSRLRQSIYQISTCNAHWFLAQVIFILMEAKVLIVR
jgi:hypothetical protein